MNQSTLAEILFCRHAKKIIGTKEIISTSPIIFKNSGTTLKNYRIYGNTQNISGTDTSVGNLVTDTQSEYFGKFAVPITVEGKNLLNATGVPSTIRGVAWTYLTDGTTTGTRTAENENVSDFTYANNITFPAGSYIFSYTNADSNPSASTYQANIIINGQSHWGTSAYSFTLNEPATIKIVLRVYPAFSGTAVFYPMIRRISVTDDIYEAYHAPSTTTLYLSQPLGKVGNTADYIDYQTQKRYNADGTVANINLPALPISSGTNVIYTDTDVPPSQISVKGKVKQA